MEAMDPGGGAIFEMYLFLGRVSASLLRFPFCFMIR